MQVQSPPKQFHENLPVNGQMTIGKTTVPLILKKSQDDQSKSVTTTQNAATPKKSQNLAYITDDGQVKLEYSYILFKLLSRQKYFF